jgi:hypothetical protein
MWCAYKNGNQIYKWSLPLLVKIGEQIDYFNLSVVYDLEIYVPHTAIVIEYFCSMRDFWDQVLV